MKVVLNVFVKLLVKDRDGSNGREKRKERERERERERKERMHRFSSFFSFLLLL